MAEGGDIPLSHTLQQLNVNQRETIDRYMNVVDHRAVHLETEDFPLIRLRPDRSRIYQTAPQELSQKVVPAATDRSVRDKQVEAVIEQIEISLRLRAPSGLIIDRSKVSAPILPRTNEVLANGSSNGEIYIVTDPVTGENSACKTIMISQFHGDHVRTWLHLADRDLAPQLYSFRQIENKVEFKQEIINGKNLNDIIDELHREAPPTDIKSFSMIVLKDLLTLYKNIQDGGYTHGDVHGGNLMMTQQMDLKVIDFDSARHHESLSYRERPRRVKNDIVGIIRLFSALYSGYGFEDLQQAIQILEADDLTMLNSLISHIPQEDRKEMYKIMMNLFGCVKDPEQQGFGDTTLVQQLIQSRLAQEAINVSDVKRRVAVILFPELFQPALEESDSGLECETCESCDMLWDHPDMSVYTTLVTDDTLAKYGLFL